MQRLHHLSLERSSPLQSGATGEEGRVPGRLRCRKALTREHVRTSPNDAAAWDHVPGLQPPRCNLHLCREADVPWALGSTHSFAMRNVYGKTLFVQQYVLNACSLPNIAQVVPRRNPQTHRHQALGSPGTATERYREASLSSIHHRPLPPSSSSCLTRE